MQVSLNNIHLTQPHANYTNNQAQSKTQPTFSGRAIIYGDPKKVEVLANRLLKSTPDCDLLEISTGYKGLKKYLVLNGNDLKEYRNVIEQEMNNKTLTIMQIDKKTREIVDKIAKQVTQFTRV